MEAVVHALEKAAVLVALTFALGRTGFVARLTSRPAPRDPLLALAFFTLMALTEVWIAAHEQELLSARLIAACVAGLLAGPWIGIGVGAGAGTLVAILEHAAPVFSVLPMAVGGLAGGLVRRYRPVLALRPSVGFILVLALTLVWYGAALLRRDGTALPPGVEALRAVVNGAGVALLLLVVDQMRAMDAQARAAAMAEVRALQARMHPHFLFNALNTLAALAETNPEAVPRVAARLARFMRAALEQHDRPFVPLREELDAVSAYLEIELLRFGDHLRLEQEIDPAVLDVPVPPFLIQPLVENALRHGIQARETDAAARGLVRLEIRPQGNVLLVRVEDNGPGIPPERRRAILHGPPDDAHALALLRRRLHGLYGNTFSLTIGDRAGGGTVMTIRIPLAAGPVVSNGEER